MMKNNNFIGGEMGHEDIVRDYPVEVILSFQNWDRAAYRTGVVSSTD